MSDLSVCQSVFQYTCLSAVCVTVCLCCLSSWMFANNCMTVCLPVSLLVSLPACMPVWVPTDKLLPVCLSACVFVCLHVCLRVLLYAVCFLNWLLPICLPVCLSVCVCPSVCLFQLFLVNKYGSWRKCFRQIMICSIFWRYFVILLLEIRRSLYRSWWLIKCQATAYSQR